MPEAILPIDPQHNPYAVDGTNLPTDTGNSNSHRRAIGTPLLAKSQAEWEKNTTEFQVWLLKFRNHITDLCERHQRCTALYTDYTTAMASQHYEDANQATHFFHNEALNYMAHYPSHAWEDPQVPARWIQQANTLWELKKDAEEEGRQAFWCSEPYVWYHCNAQVQCKPITHI